MSLTIDLVPELETEVRKVAQQAGVAPDRYVANLLSEHLLRRSATLPLSEATLLKQVNLGLSAQGWQRYHALRTKLQDETLTPTEQQELKQLTDQLEAANVRRIEALIKLAQLRNKTLDTLIDELGIRPPAYV
jgi:hypothetical protein